ncbi:hypothetical protein GETHPA_10560 [Geothrix rubra]|uniref:SprA family protein n=1 Tax=Geothrix rubra TaxID=2927977 RepID=A0ABQ5Q4S7_9BACT|nr:putative metalloprotease CJM1_0395 family protein [Geothrix rubra]GLH69523.1 hypothetical protein GETHPA_10560 [Geothrix rubra]
MPISPLSGPAPSSAPGGQPSAAQAREIADLKARDQRVRAHEAAHLTAAGGLARGGASYTYERGPDGVAYAVGGEVGIDTSPVPGNPAATLAKARQIQAAAMAPADPSAQDRSVASAAAALAARAQRDLQRVQTGRASGRSLDVVA